MVRSALAVALATVLLALAAPAAADAPDAVSYVPPVDGAIVDGFRPPSTRYGAGNRGVDYATTAGQAVRAAADGTVVFAGRIGDSSHVVVLHADGLRTSYSFLADVTVRRGQHVVQGDVVGVAGDEVHFGARAGDEYLDPTTLFGGGPARVRLVRTDLKQPAPEWRERRGLLDGLRGVPHRVASGTVTALTPVARMAVTHGWDATRRAVLDAADQLERVDAALRAVRHVTNAPFVRASRRAIRVERVVEDQRECTPADVADPIAPAAGHLLVLVGGRGSSTGHTPLLDLDTTSLGYRPDDVVQFSYAGGTRPYTAHDTERNLARSGADLRALLVDLGRTHPGATVDVIAHSQGGLVTRAALSGVDTWAPDLPVIANVVTIDSPHHGALAATADALLGTPMGGDAARDMASSSRAIAALDRRGLPANTRFTSIAGSGDLIVDAQLSAVDHATNAVVHAEGLHAHDQVVTLPATHREVALALAGRGPACRAPRDLADDLALADAIDLANGLDWVARRADDLLHWSAAPGGIGSPG